MPRPTEKYPKSPYNDFRRARDVAPTGASNLPGEVINNSFLSLSPGTITKTFDEPTYLTFRLRFFYDNVKTDNTDFDRLPMPLFNNYTEDQIEARNQYSTVQYLRDMNEDVRAEMMKSFIRDWNILQMEYQYYFQSISGLDSILSVNPAVGQRVPGESRIELTMLEGLDLRITHLLDIYRKIAWDDVYQRWILPDIMRHFKMEIYITEFRSFHRANVGSAQNPGDLFKPAVLQLIRNFTPVYIIECERCEFDITSIKKIPDSLTVADAEMREVNFSIKVGNLKERYINPILNYYYYDMLVNGYDRSFDSTEANQQLAEIRQLPGTAGQAAAATPDFPVDPTNLSTSLDPKARAVYSSYAKGEVLTNPDHETGDPFIQSGELGNIQNSSPNYNIDVASVNPTDPATWAGNALTAGKAFLENLVEQQIDKASTMKIPGLGISFNEGLAAIQSKNVFTLFGAARRAISENVRGTLPSQELEDNFVDTKLVELLEGIVQSEATSDEALDVQEAANTALNDEGVWQKVKDYSKATNILSQALGERNIPNEIQNPNSLKSSYANVERVDQTLANPLVYEGPPSYATSGLADDTVPQGINRGDLGSTDGRIDRSSSSTSASSELGNDAGESLERPEDGLGDNAGSHGPTSIPSEKLGTNAGSSLDQPEDGLGTDAGDTGTTAQPSEKLSDDAGSSPISLPPDGLGTDAGGSPISQPEDGLGNDAGGQGTTAKPSQNLGSSASGGLSKQELSDGGDISGESLDIPKPGEATNDKNIQG